MRAFDALDAITRPLIAGLLCGASAAAVADAPAVWVASWTAPPQAVWGADFAFPTTIPERLEDQTIRQVARLSLGGRRVRVVLSNAYGDVPLQIGAAHLARAGNRPSEAAGNGSSEATGHGSTQVSGSGSAIIATSDRVLTFGGRPSVTLPPGAPVVSDPIELPGGAVFEPLSRVAISLYLPRPTTPRSFHWDGRQTAWIAPGDQTAATRFGDDATTTTARLVLSAIEVEADSPARAVAVLGDSITDGNGATLDADTRWPDFLAARLAPHGVAVLNAGISGARLLSDRMGANALARFERDVLAQPGVAAVIVLIGINDIAWPGTAFDRDGRAPSVDALVDGYRQLIARAHGHGLRIVGATLTPFRGALAATPLDDYYQPAKEAMRARLNAWIRDSGEFDAVLDFDSLLRDPADPTRLLPAFDSGDHLHPGDRGNEAMADAVDLHTLLPAAGLHADASRPVRQARSAQPRPSKHGVSAASETPVDGATSGCPPR